MIEIIPTGPFKVNTLVVSLGGPYVFIVDPAACPFSGDTFAISCYLEEKKLIPLLIILTHGHFDHVSGLKKLHEDFPAAKILIHEKDKDFIGKNSSLLQGRSLSLMGFEEFLPYVCDLPEADAFLQNKKSLWECAFSSAGSGALLKGDEKSLKEKLSLWGVLHTPGHSPGSVCLYNGAERTLISGDTIFYQSYGRTDLPGGDESLICKSLKELYHTIPSNTLVYPGHDYCGFCIQENL